MKVAGVGHGTQQCTQEVELLTATPDHTDMGHLDHYQVPVLNDEDTSNHGTDDLGEIKCDHGSDLGVILKLPVVVETPYRRSKDATAVV